jgi:sulfate transport system substrate-binding protein
MTIHLNRRQAIIAGGAVAAVAGTARSALAAPPPVTLLNVSYDPTRELYKAYNAVFAADWKKKTGQEVSFEQSHGGSGKQALSVLNGLQADVVTLGISSDIDILASQGHLLPATWESRLLAHSSPYTSTIVFLVRAGNPKNIRTWADLVKPGVQIITPNPKTSAGGRWNYIAAYAQALKAAHGNESAARDYVKKIYQAVPVLDSGARGSTTTFVQRGQGDVLLAWENEAFLAADEIGPGKVEIVAPPISVLAEPPVAWVDKVVERKGTAEVAKAYLKGLYSERGQDIIAKNYYRPRSLKALEKYGSRYPKIPLINVRDLGGWSKLQPEHFGDGGVFDQLYKPVKS